MSLPKFTPHMLKNQPDQTAYLLNKLVSEGVSTGGEGGKLYPSTGQHTDGAMTQKATTDALSLKANSNDVNAALANKVDKEAGKGLSSNDFTDEDKTKLANIPTNIMTTDTAQTVTGTKTFHNAEIATDNMITLKNNSTSLIRGMAGIEYRQLLKRGSTDVEVGNTHDPLALKGSGTRPKYNSTNLLVDSDLDNVVFHDDPSTVVPTVPYVNTGDIVNEAVTSDKIDLGSLILSSYKSVSTPDTETVYKTDPLTVKTAGKYFCYTFNLSSSWTSTGVLFSYVFLNNVQMTNGQENGVSGVRQQGDVVHILDCQAGDTIQGGFYLNPNTGNPSRVECNFIAIRVA